MPPSLGAELAERNYNNAADQILYMRQTDATSRHTAQIYFLLMQNPLLLQ